MVAGTSVSSDLSGYVERVAKLVQLDAALLSIETKENLQSVGVSIGFLAGAVATAFLGLIILLFAAVLLLQVELAQLDLLHDGGPGKRFRNGAGAEQCRFRIDGNFFGDVRVAETFGVEQLAVLDDGHDGASDIGMADLYGHEAVEKRAQVGGG